MATAPWLALVCAALLLLVEVPSNAEMGPPVPAEKKLLGFACDVVNPAYLQENIASLEQIPLDGLIISVHPDDSSQAQLGGTGRSSLWFGGQAFERSDFQQTIAQLQSTEFRRFTDNFMDFNAGGDLRGLGVPDWFSEEWSRVSQNAAVAAYVAREGGLKGLFIDTEAYGNGGPGGPWRHPFAYGEYSEFYSGTPPHTLAECIAKARQRGKEFMQAMTAVYPKITIVFTNNTGWTGEETYKLLGPFVDGMLEGLGPEATLWDGGERGYPLMTYPAFMALRHLAAASGTARTAVPELYQEEMRYAFGVWVDHSPGTYGGWHTEPGELGKNQKSPERWEHTLYNALTASDGYVWLFTLHPQVWWRPEWWGGEEESSAKQLAMAGTGWRCALCPHREVPGPYLEATRNCRSPRDLDWTPAIPADRFGWFDGGVAVEGTEISDDQPNLLAGGGFETWSAGEDRAPDGWILGGQGGALVFKDSTMAKQGLSCARLGSTLPSEHVYLHQWWDAAPWEGRTLTMGIWVKETGCMEVVYSEPGTWLHLAVVGYDGAGEWQFLTATVTVPDPAPGKIRVWLSAHLPYIPTE